MWENPELLEITQWAPYPFWYIKIHKLKFNYYKKKYLKNKIENKTNVLLGYLNLHIMIEVFYL